MRVRNKQKMLFHWIYKAKKQNKRELKREKKVNQKLKEKLTDTYLLL